MRPTAWAATWLAVVLGSAGCPTSSPIDDVDGGVPLRSAGEGCVATEDCASGLCLDVGRGRAVCTAPCVGESECPAGSSWGCILPVGLDARVCGCAASRDDELCGDGLDNECNGRVDDCRLCGGVPVPEDDPRNCGTCGVACRLDQECSGGACRCPAGLSECDGACVDLGSSDVHCGVCGRACSIASSCIGGSCECDPPNPDLCGGRCTDITRDPAHCGACDEPCETGLTCTDGSCACPDPAAPTYCAGTGCVDTRTDARNCGTCGSACAAAETCQAGACGCPLLGTTLCGDVCVSTASDPLHCGTCGNTCRAGERCTGGACVCDSGLICGAVCVPVGDAANCGACGVSCRADQRCFGTGCACVAPLIECGFACLDPRADIANCGVCGLACGPGQVCTGGTCVCPSGAATFCASTGCVDTRTDRTNCGTCGTVCPPAQTCSSSACRCPVSGQTFCAASGACVDLLTDESSCGTCGSACPAVTMCTSGACRCPISGQTYCASADACVETASDEAHCGRCDAACVPATSCRFGSCTCDAPGLSLCGSSCVDLRTDAAHCGVCARACTGGRECRSSVCECPPPVPGSLVRMTTSAARSADVRMASDGTRIAMVWTERPSSGTTGFSVRFVLLEADGTRVPGTELPLATDPAAGSPDVVWTGTEYGVVWTQTVAPERHAMFQRFDSAGVPIGVAVSVTEPWTGTTLVDYVRVAWASGSGFGTLIRPASSTEIYFQGLGADASVLALPVRMAEAVSGTIAMGIAGATDGRFAMLYGTRVQVLNADGSITVPSVGLPTGVSSPVIRWDGETWLVAATRTYFTGTGNRAQVILLRGAALATTHVAYDVPTTAASLDEVAIAIDGGMALLVWTDDTDASGSRRLQTSRVRLPTGGATFQVIAPAGLLMSDYTVANDARPETVLVGPSVLFTAWPDTRWGQYELYALAATITPCS